MEVEEPDLDFEECSTKRWTLGLHWKQKACSTGKGNPLVMVKLSPLASSLLIQSVCHKADGKKEEEKRISKRSCCVYVAQQRTALSSSVTAAASAESSVVKSVVSGPVTDTCGPISSVCSPTSSAWDTLRSTSDRDPVSAAAHLHLLGESLSLIGHHLQETNKAVSMSSSVSLLLDSLLCALAPLLCLTAQIPELKSCTQHTLPSTLENISYLMPGL
ncbi:uncharacterized protein hmgxb4b isoform X3 [Anarhichas minor]|uniref:uncharacterized protein hmgxb4b isoform X3 n=1 Tax=Anarhichas minor TaxID=65739 RepID=UPI003F739B7D